MYACNNLDRVSKISLVTKKKSFPNVNTFTLNFMTKISQFQQKIILFHDKNEVKIASALLHFNKTGFTELVMRNK